MLSLASLAHPGMGCAVFCYLCEAKIRPDTMVSPRQSWPEPPWCRWRALCGIACSLVTGILARLVSLDLLGCASASHPRCAWCRQRSRDYCGTSGGLGKNGPRRSSRMSQRCVACWDEVPLAYLLMRLRCTDRLLREAIPISGDNLRRIFQTLLARVAILHGSWRTISVHNGRLVPCGHEGRG